MATKDDTRARTTANTYESIRKEIADALGIDESDEGAQAVIDETYAQLVVESKERDDVARVERNNEIIQDALAHGRHVNEWTERLGDVEVTRFVEYVPGPNMDVVGGVMDVLVRIGTVTVMGDEPLVRTSYFDPNKLGGKLADVFSVIKDGKETITQVNDFTGGLVDLKPGDTRDVPAPSSGPAGTRPSTWDPASDGRYGSTQPKSESSSEPTSESSSSRTDTGAAAPPDALHERYDGSSAAADSGDKTTDWVRYDKDGNETARGTETVHKDGSVTVTTTSGAATGSVTYASKEEQAKAEVQQEPGTVTTEGDTTVEVEAPSSDDDDTEHTAGYGDYADTGPTPPAQVGVSETIDEAGAGHRQTVYSGKFGDFIGNPVQDQRIEAEVTGAPMDFGDAADPNADPPPTPDDIEVPLYGQGAQPHGTQILVDPDAGDTTLSPEQIDFASSLRRSGDYGDPNDPNRQEAPAPAENPLDSSPYEHLVDASAVVSADLAMAAIDQPELGAGGGLAASADARDTSVGEWGGDDFDGDGLPG
jgi:hypothetical protein